MTLKEKINLIKFGSKAKLLAPILNFNKAQGAARLLGSAASKRLGAAGSTAQPTSKLKQLVSKTPTPPTAQTTLTPNTMEKHKLMKYFLGSTPANAAVR